MFAQAANEVSRRMNLLDHGRSSSQGIGSSVNDYLVESSGIDELDSTFERAPPLTFARQNVALVAKCNKGLKLHSESAGFNVLGFFNDKESVLKVLKKHKAKFDKSLDIDLVIVPVRAFAMIEGSSDCSDEYVLDKIEQIKNNYIKQLMEDRQQSDKNRKEHKIGTTPLSSSSTQQPEEEKEEKEEKEESDDGENIVITDSIKEITSPGKTCYTCSLIKDNISTEDNDINEPLFQLYASFDTSKSAYNWIEKTGSKYITDIHIDCFKIGMWVFPHRIESSKVKELYRNKEESMVMNSVKEQSEKVLNFKRECHAEGKSFKEINMTQLRGEKEKQPEMKNGKLVIPKTCFTIEKCEAGKLAKPVDPQVENQELEWEFSKNVRPTN